MSDFLSRNGGILAVLAVVVAVGAGYLEWTSFDSVARVFDGPRTFFDRQHPTQKPIRLIEWCIEKTAGSVIDPFMGSGTTGVACANLGRKFIGIEIERKYFDIACERIDAAYAQGRLFA